MCVDPFNDLFCAGRAAHAGCLNIDRIGDAHRQPGLEQDIQSVGENQREQR
jgi:hypothetical protein